jgi:hypothetical protein
LVHGHYPRPDRHLGWLVLVALDPDIDQLFSQCAKEKSASNSGALRCKRHPGYFRTPDGMRVLLLGSLHVTVGTQANGMTEGNVVETSGGVVSVDGDAERHGLAGGQHGVAGSLRVKVTV